MSLRARQITSFRADDEASNRFQEHLKEVLNPLLRELASPEAWQAPTLVNGWTNYGGGYAPAGYMIDAFGFVHLRGLLANAAGVAANSVAFTLPEKYRPAAQQSFFNTTETAGTGARIDVLANGQVWPSVNVAVAANGFRSLSGITFDTRP